MEYTRSAKFYSRLITEELLGSKYAKLILPFRYYSPFLKQLIIVPTGFICDYESVPFLKASSKRAGVIHDYLCRFDCPYKVTKQMAATIYLECQECRDELLKVTDSKVRQFWRPFARHFKSVVVRCAGGYFHKLSVYAKLINGKLQ